MIQQLIPLKTKMKIVITSIVTENLKKVILGIKMIQQLFYLKKRLQVQSLSLIVIYVTSLVIGVMGNKSEKFWKQVKIHLETILYIFHLGVERRLKFMAILI